MKLTILITIILAFMTAEAKFGGKGPGGRARGSGTDGGGGTARLCWADSTIPDRIRSSQPDRKHVFYLSEQEDEAIALAESVELYDTYLVSGFGVVGSYDIPDSGRPQVTYPRLIERYRGESIDDYIERIIGRFDMPFPLLSAELRTHHKKVQKLTKVPAQKGIYPANDVVVRRGLGENCLLATMIYQNLKNDELVIDFRIYGHRQMGPNSRARTILHEVVLSRFFAWDYAFQTAEDLHGASGATIALNPYLNTYPRMKGKKFDKTKVNHLVKLLVSQETNPDAVLKDPFSGITVYNQQPGDRRPQIAAHSTNKRWFDTFLFRVISPRCFDKQKTHPGHFKKTTWWRANYISDIDGFHTYLKDFANRKTELLKKLKEENFGKSFLTYFDRYTENFRLRVAGLGGRRGRGKVKNLQHKICEIQHRVEETIKNTVEELPAVRK